MTLLADHADVEAARAAHERVERLRRRLARMGMPGVWLVRDETPATAHWWANQAYALAAKPPIRRARTRLRVEGSTRVLEIWFEDWALSARTLEGMRGASVPDPPDPPARSAPDSRRQGRVDEKAWRTARGARLR